jgi:plastocyanin
MRFNASQLKPYKSIPTCLAVALCMALASCSDNPASDSAAPQVNDGPPPIYSGTGPVISGTVKLSGNPRSVDVTTYSGTITGCGGTGYHKSENWKLGPNGELADVVVWVVNPKPASGSVLPPIPTPKVNQIQCTYVPHVVVTTPGQGIEFLNSDPVLHNVLARISLGADHEDGDMVFNLPEVSGQRAVRSFETPGIYSLQCNSHSWMQAWVDVLPAPSAYYYAVTDKNGAFTLGFGPYVLADGDYIIKAWHPRFHDALEATLHCVKGSGSVQFVFSGDKSF